MHADESYRLHHSFALQHALVLRDTVLKTYQAAQELQAARHAQDVSKHTTHLKQTLGTMMFLAAAEDVSSLVLQPSDAADSPASDGHAAATSIRATVLSTLLLLTTWCEKNATVTKALHEVCCWEWVWRGMQRVLTWRAPSPVRNARVADVSCGAEVTFDVAASLSRFCSRDWREFSTGLRTLANLVACKERRISEPYVASGAFRAACQTVVFASHTRFLLSRERAQDACYAAAREATKQAARLIGNACFGSGAHGKECATDSAKQALLLEVLECPCCSRCPRHEHIVDRVDVGDEIDLVSCPGVLLPKCTCTLGAACTLLSHVSPRGASRDQSAVDAPLTRWLLHILNEYSYGGAPNRRQQTLLAHGVHAALVELILALFHCGDHSSTDREQSAERTRRRWVLRDDAWASCAGAAIMTLHNVAFRLEHDASLSSELPSGSPLCDASRVTGSPTRSAVEELRDVVSDVVLRGDTSTSSNVEGSQAAVRGAKRSDGEAILVKAALMLLNRLPLFSR